MRKTNDTTSFGFLFNAGAALASPVHELITREPLYHVAPPRRRRSQPYHAASPRRRRSALYRLIAGMAGALEGWRQRHEQRRALAMLSDHLLRDVGLTRQDAEEELRKPFWR